MRLTHAFTLAALAGAAIPAAAQTSRSDVRIRRAPEARAFSFARSGAGAALGLTTRATGTLRDTLGLLVTSITKDSPAERAGLEEGNRIAAINGVSLRANAADIEDIELSNALTHRLTRELQKVKPGDEVELRVYRDGRTQPVRVKTADADSVFARRSFVSFSRAQLDDRPALGFGIGASGSRRDTLGVLVISVQDSTPAAAAGLEEGNRIAAINGVDLRVAREDAGDNFMASARAQRLMREVSKLKPGSDVTLRVYSDGRFRDVKMKVARAGDLPRSRGMMIFSGVGPMAPMPVMAPMAPMAPMPMVAMPVPATPRMRVRPAEPPSPPDEPDAMDDVSDLRFEIGPQIEAALHEAGVKLERVRPQLERVLRDLPMTLERIKVPTVYVDVAV
ncbi:MAG TPA: PDZ domain-containing protein [Gemmatimonadaceae bacterium]|nr:PDZ domain-containing protein [Gemmatimonadaceae bacterium]